MTDKKATKTTASTLLEAVVSAELGLRDLEGTCASLEGLITEGRDLLAAAQAVAPEAPGPPSLERPALVEPPPAQTVPLEVPERPAEAEAPAATVDEPEREDAPDEVAEDERPATKRSLEEQAAALRAAMESVSKPAGVKPDTEPAKAAKAAKTGNGQDPEKGSAAPSLDRRPFLPKRTSPLRSRLAREEDGSPTPQEGESYSDRSAELEHLLRSEQNS